MKLQIGENPEFTIAEYAEGGNYIGDSQLQTRLLIPPETEPIKLHGTCRDEAKGLQMRVYN